MPTTTGKLIGNGIEHRPPGTKVTLRPDLSCGSIVVEHTTMIDVGDVCSLVLDDGRVYEVVLRRWHKQNGELFMLFDINEPEFTVSVP